MDGRQLTGAIRRRLTGKRQAGSHEVIIEAIKQHPQVMPIRGKRLADQLAELKDMRVQADYYRDPMNRGTTSIFATYNVSDWSGLSKAAMTLASNLLPELQRL